MTPTLIKLYCTLDDECRKILRKAHDNYGYSARTINKLLKVARTFNIKLLTFYDPLYPAEAKSIIDSPILLYYKGHIREDSMGVAIVGSRRCSNYGKRVTTETASFLAKQGISVISGMAKGIDSYAHTVCLKEGGYTIAFLGNGLDICYAKRYAFSKKKSIN